MFRRGVQRCRGPGIAFSGSDDAAVLLERMPPAAADSAASPELSVPRLPGAVPLILFALATAISSPLSYFLGLTKLSTTALSKPIPPARDVPRYGVHSVACGHDCDGSRALRRYDEAGYQARGKAQPGRDEHCGCGHTWPEEDQADEDGGAAYDCAEDGEEPSEGYGGCVGDGAEAVGAGESASSIASQSGRQVEEATWP